MQSAREGKNVYGLTNGVGINKDKVIFTGDVLSPEAPEDVVRATLLVRLNKVLRGHSALLPSVATMYADMLT